MTVDAADSTRLGTARCLLLDSLAVDITGVLRRAEVESLLLKGASIASWLWPGEPRLYGDVDLLVPSASLPSAERTLSDLGFADRRARPLASGAEKSRPWSRPGSPLVIDLHHNLVGVEAPDAKTWEMLWRHRERLMLGGGEVWALDEPAKAMHVVLHAVQHKRHGKPLRDLRRAFEVLPIDVWRAAADLSAELDALDAFGGGLLLVDAGRDVASDLGIDPRMSVDIALRLASPHPVAHGFERVASARGLRAKLSLLGRRLVPRPALLRHWSPLARRGVVGLALAYVWRALSLAGKALPALVEWRRARRSARRHAG